MRIRIVICALLLAGLAGELQAQQDVNISGQNVYQVLARGAAWGSNAAPNVPGQGGGVNNNFLFQAVNPNTQVCLYVRNNNPTTGHSVTVRMWQAGDPSVKVFTNDSSAWNQATTLQANTISIPAHSTQVWFFNVSAGAMLAAQISGSTAAGGSPDTADIIADQTTSGQCGVAASVLPVAGPDATGTAPSAGSKPVQIAGVNGSGNVTRIGVGTGSGAGTGTPLATALSGVIGGVKLGSQTYLGGDVGPPFVLNTPFTFCGISRLCAQENHQAAFELLPATASTGSWIAQNTATNPGANADLISFAQTGSGSGSPAFFVRAWIDCSAACDVQVFRVTTLGTTCTTVSNVANPYLNQGTAYAGQFSGASGAINSACTTNPTTGAMLWEFTLPASGMPYEFDLRGVACNIVVSSPCGLMFVNHVSLTGTVAVSVEWYED